MSNPTTLVWQSTVTQTFKLSILATALASISVLTACTSTPSTKNPSKSTAVTAQNFELLDADGLGGLEDLLYATDMRAVENDRLQILRHGDVWKRMSVNFGMQLDRKDSRIEAQRGWFISRQPYIDRLSARASRYIHYTVKEAERRGIPTELALLPIIESSYDPAATSSAAAAGLWQIIPSTGKIYGLRQNDLYDGRRDVVESTRAAYEYLSSLYNQFGSWELALASYNAGPGRIQQAINRNKAAGLPTDYWSLKLPTETMNYVPRFIAVAQIIKNPQQYAVTLPPIANRPHFREVTLPGAIDLDELSRLTGVSRGELYALNPGNRGNYTDALAPRRILIPNHVNASVDAKIAKMSTVSGSGGMWTGEVAALPILPTISTSTKPATGSTTTSVSTRPSSALVTNQPSQLPNSSVLTNSTKPAVLQPVKPIVAAPSVSTKTVTTTTSNEATAATKILQKTPSGAQALAAFASNATVPSAPRLPLSITPAVIAKTNTPVKAIVSEPPISAAEKQTLVALIEQQEKTDKAKAEIIAQQIVAPKPTEQQQQDVINELEEIAPKGTEIVDPMDGTIKLTALQSSQSIADQKGEELKIGFAYPRSVAEAEKNSADAARNQGKPMIQTSKEVVVIAPQGKRDIYSVQAGDTLAGIAARFGVNWRDIATWNQINPDSSLFVGTRLYLYNAKPVVIDAPKPTRYVVKAGDSLTAIAQQFNVSLQDLAAWNNLTVNSNVLIGQNLVLVEPKNFKPAEKIAETVKDTRASQTSTANNDSKSKIETETYTVKSGEFLKLIADRHAISVSELIDLNSGLSVAGNVLVGQKIKVPKVQEDKPSDSKTSTKVVAAKFDTMVYTVAAGDYLSTVAQKHKMTLVEIAELNQLNISTNIMVGQKLKVKATDAERPSSYRVKTGDSLSAVADKFDLTLQQIASFNGLKTDTKLKAGQVLKLEGDAEKISSANTATKTANAEVQATSSYSGATESYQVKAGENLTVLAQRYDMSVADLAALNKLTARSNLLLGQKLQVPKLTTSYKVKRGDTLIGLAQRFGISTESLAEMNSIKADTQVRLGQILTVPN